MEHWVVVQYLREQKSEREDEGMRCGRRKGSKVKSSFCHPSKFLFTQPPSPSYYYCLGQSLAWKRFHLFVFCADGMLSHDREGQLKYLPSYFRGANVTPCLSWACYNALFTCMSHTHLVTERGARLYKILNPLYIWIVRWIAAVPVNTEVSRVPSGESNKSTLAPGVRLGVC